MGHAKELITMDVYGDNANIIPEEIPELLSYMEEVMQDKSRDNDNESTMQDIMIDVDRYLPEKEYWKMRIQIKVHKFHKVDIRRTNVCFGIDKWGTIWYNQSRFIP